MNLVIPLFIAGAVAIFGSWLIWSLYRAPMLAIGLILTIFFVETLMGSSASLNVGGMNLFLPDMIFAPIAVAAILRIFRKEFFRPLTLAWLFFGGLLFVNFVIGLTVNGKAAGVDFREYFYFWSGSLYFMSFQLHKLPFIAIGRHWVKVAILFSAIAIFRWGTDAAGLSDWTVIGAGTPFRVMTAREALFMAYGLIILMGISLNGMKLKASRLLLPLFIIVILLLQHRSVWLSVVAGVGVLYFVINEKITKKIAPVAGIFIILIVVGVFMTTTDFGKKAIASIEDSGTSAAQGEGTVAARTYSWTQLLKQWDGGGVKTHLIGFPFGTIHSRYESDLSKQAVEYAPHNYYLETLLRTGVIGLATFLLICIWAVYGLWKRGRSRTPVAAYSGIFLALLVAEIIYFIPYGATYEQSIIFGLALNLAFSVSPIQKIRRPLQDEHGEYYYNPSMS
ncbi:MAG: O-antigen ligase family protein [Burkholderiaceae bacterium]